jgi:hypothetical protein
MDNEDLTAKLAQLFGLTETYYSHDNAYYRRLATSGGWVDDVWTDEGWSNYTGDKSKPWCFGSKIQKANLPIAAGGQGLCPANVRFYKDGEARAEAKAEEADNKARKRRTLPKGFREVGSPGDAWTILGASKPKP